MIRTLRSTNRLPSGNVCATVVDEHLRIVRVVVPFGNTDHDTLCAIIDQALDSRRPGAPETEALRGH